MTKFKIGDIVRNFSGNSVIMVTEVFDGKVGLFSGVVIKSVSGNHGYTSNTFQCDGFEKLDVTIEFAEKPRDPYPVGSVVKFIRDVPSRFAVVVANKGDVLHLVNFVGVNRGSVSRGDYLVPSVFESNSQYWEKVSVEEFAEARGFRR